MANDARFFLWFAGFISSVLAYLFLTQRALKKEKKPAYPLVQKLENGLTKMYDIQEFVFAKVPKITLDKAQKTRIKAVIGFGSFSIFFRFLDPEFFAEAMSLFSGCTAIFVMTLYMVFFAVVIHAVLTIQPIWFADWHNGNITEEKICNYCEKHKIPREIVILPAILWDVFELVCSAALVVAPTVIFEAAQVKFATQLPTVIAQCPPTYFSMGLAAMYVVVYYVVLVKDARKKERN